MLTMGVTTRLVSALMGVVLVATLAAVGLFALDHVARREALRDSHAGLVLADLRDSLEARLALGLPIGQLPEVDRLLDAARLQMADTVSVAITDERGLVVFSTDTLEVGEPAAGLGAIEREASGHAQHGGEVVFWTALASDFGTVAGAVLIRLPNDAARAGALDFTLGALSLAAAPVAVTLALAGLAGWWLARRAERVADGVASALNGLVEDPAAIDRVVVANGAPAIAGGYALAVGDQNRRLNEVEAELGRLDEMA